MLGFSEYAAVTALEMSKKVLVVSVQLSQQRSHTWLCAKQALEVLVLLISLDEEHELPDNRPFSGPGT